MSLRCTEAHQAEAAAPSEAVYPSNLSAALYELGDYSACFQSIIRASNKLSEAERQSSLLQRLSTRLAKTLCFGTRAGVIDCQDIQVAAVSVETLASAVDRAGASEEIKWAWKEWRRVERETDGVLERAAEAREGLSKLPIFKKAACVVHFRLPRSIHLNATLLQRSPA